MTFVTHYRPGNDAFSFVRDFDRLVNETLGQLSGREEGARRWTPAADVSETTEALKLRLEVPGLSNEEVNIWVENKVLTIRGEKAEETRQENEKFHRSERVYGSFERSFTLPTHVDAENVKASLRNGVLTVKMPRLPEAKAREIAIESEKAIEE